MDTRETRRRKGFAQGLAEKGYYHSFELPDGTRIEGYMGLEHQRQRWARYPLPADLHGKRLLDTGAWDGWFSFEAERRGAEVTAIDCVEMPTFLSLRERLGSRVAYRALDVYELPDAGLGTFDYVLFLGVLYHLKHPLLALEIVCALTGELAIVESFVTDPDTWREHQDDIPSMEFYETTELGENLDNWVGPTVGCVLALCRAAGFARVELLDVAGDNAVVACYRRWEPPPEDPSHPAPELRDVLNNRDYGVNFRSRRDEYLSCWFTMPRPELTREDLRFEVEGYGVPALYLREEAPGAWLANTRLPPGLAAGFRSVRLRLSDTGLSNCRRIALDVPPQSDAISVAGVCDGVTWKAGDVTSDFLSCWIGGLAENSDRNNVRVRMGEAPLPVIYIGPPDADGLRQVNLRVPPGIAGGEWPLTVTFGGASAGATVRVVR